MKIFDGGGRLRQRESFSCAFVGPLNRAAKLLAIKLIERPAIDVRKCPFQQRDGLSLPFGKRSHEILQLQHQHACELCVSSGTPTLSNSLELANGLQTHPRIG